jgi:hypothetical protein
MQLLHSLHRHLHAAIEAVPVQPLRIHDMPQMVLWVSLRPRRDALIQFVLNGFLRRVVHRLLQKGPAVYPSFLLRARYNPEVFHSPSRLYLFGNLHFLVLSEPKALGYAKAG